MKNVVRNRFKVFIKRHLLAIIAIPTALLLCAGFLYWYTSTVQAKIEATHKNLSSQLAADDLKIKKILAEKAAALKENKKLKQRQQLMRQL